jgi:hypothetical protein
MLMPSDKHQMGAIWWRGIPMDGGPGLTDAYLFRTDGSGNLMWAKSYGGANYDEVFSMDQTNDGGYIMWKNSQLWSRR